MSQDKTSEYDVLPSVPSVEVLAEAMYRTTWPVVSESRPWVKLTDETRSMWQSDAKRLRRQIASILLFEALRDEMPIEKHCAHGVTEPHLCYELTDKSVFKSGFNESGNATYEMTFPKPVLGPDDVLANVQAEMKFGDTRDPLNKALFQLDAYEHAMRCIRALMKREVGYDADVMEIMEPPWNVACIAVSGLEYILANLRAALGSFEPKSCEDHEWAVCLERTAPPGREFAPDFEIGEQVERFYEMCRKCGARKS